MIRSGVGVRCLVAAMLAGAVLTPAAADGSFDFGVNLGFVDQRAAEGFDGGLAVKLGHEFGEAGPFRAGVQWHGVYGTTDRNETPTPGDLSFRANALYLTARPSFRYLSWVQMSTGVVRARIRSTTVDPASGETVVRDPGSSRSGFALGIGIVVPSETFTVHLLDYHRYRIGGETFDLYGISILILLHAL